MRQFYKVVEKVSSDENLFLIFASVFLLVAIPITVYTTLKISDLRLIAAGLNSPCYYINSSNVYKKIDVTSDYYITTADVDAVQAHYNSPSLYKAEYDLNSDGRIDTADMLIVINKIPTTCVPVISYFQVSPSNITSGQAVTVTWSTQFATSVTLNGAAVGRTPRVTYSRTYYPTTTTRYTLVANNPLGPSYTTSTSWTVYVSSPPAEPPSSDPTPPPPDSSSPTSPPGDLPGSTISPGPGGNSPVVQNVLNELKLKISALPLVGETGLSLVVGGKAAQIRISKGIKTYSLNVSRNRFEFGEKITLLVGGSGVLTKKFSFTPDALTETINVGVITFGDISGNNRIDKEDVALILESIASQTNRGDINVDGVANSLDWALLQANFGKVGD